MLKYPRSMIKKSISIIEKKISPLILKMIPLFENANRNSLIIFGMHYHQPISNGTREEKILKENIHILKNECNLMHFEDSISYILSGKQLPHRSISIIVDDGVEGFYNGACQLFLDERIPFTVAVIPGLIKSNSRVHLVSRAMRIAGHNYMLSHVNMIERAFKWLNCKESDMKPTFTNVFKKVSKLSEDNLLKFIEFMGVPNDNFMSWEQLRHLGSFSNVRFANHTMSHPLLKFADGEWLEWELSQSANLIKQNLNINTDTLVLPYGGMENMTMELRTVLKKMDYKFALLNEPATVCANTDMYLIPRINGELETALFKLRTYPSLCNLYYPAKKYFYSKI